MYTIRRYFLSLVNKNIPFILCLFLLLKFTSVSAQKPITIMGKYKGSMLTVKGRTGTNSDVIEYFSYAPYDKLQKEVEELKRKINKLEKENAQLKKNGDNQSIMDSISSITRLLEQKENEASRMREEIESLTKSLNAQNVAQNDSMVSLGSKISELELKLYGDGYNKNSFSLGCVFGSASFVGPDGSIPFQIDIHSSVKTHVSYLAYFNQTSPFALSIGFGLGRYSFISHLPQYKETITGQEDIDGDMYDVYRDYMGVEESLSLGYLEIPIALHIGSNNSSSPVQLWGNVGAVLGFNVRNNFKGAGTYSCRGYYPQWNVVIQDIPALGFVENSELYDESTEHNVVGLLMSGTLSAGVYIPMGSKFGLDIGSGCSFTLTPIADNCQEDSFVLKKCNMVVGEKKRVFEYGLYIRLTYTL